MQITRFDMTGARELEDRLKALGTEVATKIGVAALRASAEKLQDAWERAAPFDPDRKAGRRYGHLRQNIRVRREGAVNPNVIVFRVTTGDAFWGNFLEFGTAKMAPRPWARPVVDAMKDQLVSIQSSNLREGIEAAMRKRG